MQTARSIPARALPIAVNQRPRLCEQSLYVHRFVPPPPNRMGRGQIVELLSVGLIDPASCFGQAPPSLLGVTESLVR